MKNLAGNPDCDLDIRDELTRARIPIVEVPKDTKHHEVPFSLEGRLGGFRFYRAWYYWVVQGPMRLANAERLYSDPEARVSVRVAGHCGCPAPAEWARDGVVEVYHVDTQAGLRVLADEISRLLEKPSRGDL